jgi:hypothetical protein
LLPRHALSGLADGLSRWIAPKSAKIRDILRGSLRE